MRPAAGCLSPVLGSQALEQLLADALLDAEGLGVAVVVTGSSVTMRMASAALRS